MTLTDVQAAAARTALDALKNDTEFAHPMSTIKRIAGKAAVDAVREREAEYRQFNKDVSGNSAMLSRDAAGYWADWQKMYRAGRLHHSLGGHGKREKTVSRMCERLDESFAHRVPDNEKAKFLVYDPQRSDAGNWDDRWHACVDLFPPVLREEFLGGSQVANPKGRAQLEVLSGLLSNQDVGQQGEPHLRNATFPLLARIIEQSRRGE